MKDSRKNKIADEFLNKLSLEYDIKIDKKLKTIFREAYRAGFSDGLYEAQDTLDYALDGLRNGE